ncbi:hypothetical protein S83_043860, partial [Arachis hypogaea]
MAQARYTRIDNNKKSSSSFCSTVTIVVFVALCLVGVWMMTSSSVVPAQNADVTQDNKTDAAQDSTIDMKEAQSDTKEQVTDNNNSGNTPKFEDNQGDLPEDATKGDTNVTSENNSDVKENQEEKSEDKSEEKSSKESKTEDGDKKTEDKDSPTESTESNSQTTENKDSGETEKPGSGDSEKKSESDESDTKSESNENKQSDSDESANKSDSDGSEKKSDDSSETTDNKTEDKVQQSDKESDVSSNEKETDDSANKQTSTEVYASGAQSELLNENTTQNGSFSTQAAESKNEKESQASSKQSTVYNWKLCNSTAGPDYIPCLDNLKAIRKLPSTKHYEHRERHCPEEPPTCLVPLPEGYRRPITWPKSREKIWYYNVPHTKLAEYKGHQNWVKVTGEYLTFPGGGTQFKHGALHYIDTIQQSVPDIAWGRRSRVVLDVGCGVASFGGFLFERDVLTMSLAPKDEHEAQVQFALERGVPAISAVMGTVRLPYPGRVFDIVHCARCRVPWHIEGGKLLLELNRVLRPGGFFVWSATPIYQNKTEDVEIWKEMKKLIKAMCWEVVNITRDKLNGVGIATYRKPTSNECYEQRSNNEPPMCLDSDDPNAA